MLRRPNAVLASEDHHPGTKTLLCLECSGQQGVGCYDDRMQSWPARTIIQGRRLCCVSNAVDSKVWDVTTTECSPGQRGPSSRDEDSVVSRMQWTARCGMLRRPNAVLASEDHHPGTKTLLCLD